MSTMNNIGTVLKLASMVPGAQQPFFAAGNMAMSILGQTFENSQQTTTPKVTGVVTGETQRLYDRSAQHNAFINQGGIKDFILGPAGGHNRGDFGLHQGNIPPPGETQMGNQTNTGDNGSQQELRTGLRTGLLYGNNMPMLNQYNETPGLLKGSNLGQGDTSPETVTPLGNPFNDKIDSMTKLSKGVALGGAAVGVLGHGIGLINEMRKQPSTPLRAPSYETVNLDSDQSGFVNTLNRDIEKSKSASLRRMLDMGVDPIQATMLVDRMSSDAKLKTHAQATAQRQQIQQAQAQLNTQIGLTANQMKLQTDQFNIQKQMTENQLASQNISAGIHGMTQNILSRAGAFMQNEVAGMMLKGLI